MRPATLTAEQRELLDQLISRQMPDAGRSRIAPYEGDRTAMPLSPAQQRIWFFSSLQPRTTVYNVAGAARLRGRLDAGLLHRCLGEMVERHEVLRTTYHQVDGLPVQRVNPFTGLDLPLVDLTGLPAGEREAEARRYCQEQTDLPFDLEQDVMLRPVLLRLADDEHLLLILQHHIATDGWSLNVLVRELGDRYSAHLRGEQPKLPELPVQYGDFAAWQRDHLEETVVPRQLEYWRERLADTRLVDVATGLPRPTELSWSGGTLHYRIEPEIVRRITQLAEAEQATPFMALIAAQSVVLSRWSGQNDIVIGSAVAGRRHAELEHLAGCFVNELAVRIDTSGSPTYRELLRQAKEVCLGAYDHQDVPFERIIEVVAPERDALARVPLVRHQLGFHNEPRWSVTLPEITFTIEPLSTNTARFDLEVDLSPDDDGGISGVVYFSTDVFTEDIVLRMLDSLRTVLDGAGQEPDVPVTGLSVVGGRELAWLAELGAAPASATPSTVTALLEHRARTCPDSVALRHGGAELTFRELDEHANRLSWQLKELGVAAGTPVAVCVPPSGHLLMTLFGVLKAGGAAVPLDPDRPVEDINDVLLDCNTDLVLTSGHGPAGLDSMVRSFDVTGDLSQWPATRPATVPEPAQAAFVNYLPVPDALPRGMVNSHAAVAHRLWWAADAFLGSDRHSHADQSVLAVPTGFDLSPWQLLWPVIAGARLVMATDTAPATLVDTLRGSAVTTLCCTPSTLSALLATGAALPALRHVGCAGEHPWPALAAQLRTVAPQSRLLAVHGPAHAALDVIAQPVADSYGPGSFSFTGTAVPGAVVRVLDDHRLPVPVGVPGELCLGGAPLPDGYLGRPHENRTLFTQDPLRPGERLLCTGLRARRLPDGTLDLLDGELRVRTHRVETTEIESVLQTCSDVERALVSVRTAGQDGEDHGPGLVAHVALGGRADDADHEDEQRRQFAEIYSSRSAEDDPTLNADGWNSPQTGEYLTASEMREWADLTFRRILALRPAHVLEIGCKTGALLFRLALRCETYTGTDLSAHGLRHIEDHRDWLASKSDAVTLLERAADDFAALPDGGFDTVVLNSLVQHFPDERYLERVLAGALRTVRPGGHVYVGSVRSLPLLRALHLVPELELLDPQDSAGRLREGVAARVGREEELALDPAYFTGLADRLPGVAEVFVLPRVGRHRNELSSYRYDVVLRAGDPAAPATAEATLDWQADGLTSEALTGHLRTGVPEQLLLRSVPDARIHGRLRALAALDAGEPAGVAEITSALAPRPVTAGGPVDPGALTALAEKEGYTALVQYGPDGAGESLDMLFSRASAGGSAGGESAQGAAQLPVGFGRGAGAKAADTAGRATANDPLSTIRGRRTVARLRQLLQQRLPAHGVPDHLVLVPGFPVDRDGVADTAALPGPDVAAAAVEAHREAATPTESKLAVIWSAALGVDRLGVHDDFFALGGHSLLGSEVMDKVRQEYKVDVPLGLLFESPTIAAVAGYVDEQLARPQEAAAPIKRIDRSTLRRHRVGDPAGAASSKENS
ncbi:non-ribosomal peptide synthetase [Streptomyces sp. NBC_00151]|uniref:non-ribosomal peptide synthetase n=1 Tax=Streptomyces sp. NBC_00151 TaxID=2975669 RepID=UPI002DDBA843|nr:condensation domain-containing protein [Streptomyces sp. NBC_00151]WRZ40355.1 condensation domain-containing protein [Streptomyces sp. NBC_00151]